MNNKLEQGTATVKEMNLTIPVTYIVQYEDSEVKKGKSSTRILKSVFDFKFSKTLEKLEPVKVTSFTLLLSSVLSLE